MKELWITETDELLCKRFDCSCGREHFAFMPVVSGVGISEEVNNLIPRGARVLILASLHCACSFSDSVHSELEKEGYTVSRFSYERSEENPIPDIPEGTMLIVAIGEESILERAKLLASSFDTSLILIPSTFNYARLASKTSVLDYGGTRIVRPSRAPDKIMFFPEVYAGLTKVRFAGVIGELFSKILTFCDYKYRSESDMECCDGIIYSAEQAFKALLEVNIVRSVESVKQVFPSALRINALLYMTGEEEGGEGQIATCIEKFTLKKGREQRERGELLLLSAVLAGRLYDTFLARDSLYSIADENKDADLAITLLGLTEGESVRLSSFSKESDFGFEDYKFKLNKEGLKRCVKEGNILLRRAFDAYRRLVPDGCYSLKYYVSVREMLELLSCSPFYTKRDTLLGFIKERGLLEFEKGLF